MTSVGTHLQRKILLYRELIDVLLQEQKSLRSNDINPLWQLAQQKRALAQAIETERVNILQLLEQEGIRHGMSSASFRLSQLLKLLPDDICQNLGHVHVTLAGLKQEVGALAHTNRRFVEDSLKTIDALLALFTEGKEPSPVYSRSSFRGGARRQKLQMPKGV